MRNALFRLARWCLTFCFCAMMLVVRVHGLGFELKSVTTPALLDRTGSDGQSPIRYRPASEPVGELILGHNCGDDEERFQAL